MCGCWAWSLLWALGWQGALLPLLPMLSLLPLGAVPCLAKTRPPNHIQGIPARRLLVTTPTATSTQTFKNLATHTFTATTPLLPTPTPSLSHTHGVPTATPTPHMAPWHAPLAGAPDAEVQDYLASKYNHTAHTLLGIPKMSDAWRQTLVGAITELEVLKQSTMVAAYIPCAHKPRVILMPPSGVAGVGTIVSSIIIDDWGDGVEKAVVSLHGTTPTTLRAVGLDPPVAASPPIFVMVVDRLVANGTQVHQSPINFTVCGPLLGTLNVYSYSVAEGADLASAVDVRSEGGVVSRPVDGCVNVSAMHTSAFSGHQLSNQEPAATLSTPPPLPLATHPGGSVFGAPTTVSNARAWFIVVLTLPLVDFKLMAFKASVADMWRLAPSQVIIRMIQPGSTSVVFQPRGSSLTNAGLLAQLQASPYPTDGMELAWSTWRITSSAFGAVCANQN